MDTMRNIADDEAREHPTTDEWRKMMRAARKAQGHTQKSLAEAITRRFGRTVTQAMVSEIERGTAAASSFVIPVCRVLSIPPPNFTVGADIEWASAGALLREKNPAVYRTILGTITELLKSTGK